MFYSVVSAILLGVGLYFHNASIAWCFIASGLFAIAGAISGLDIIVDTDGDSDGKRG